MTKSQLIEVFLGFLHQLLHHNTDSWWRGRRHVKILETELRFLHTIFEDISSMLLDWNDHQYEAQFQDLMEEFEAVANQAGCFIHSMLFSTHLGFRETEELAAAIHGVDCLKATLKSSDIITTPPCTTPRTSTVNSVIFFVSLVNDVQDLLQGEDDRIINTDVKDQINLLYQGLIFLHSSINDMRSPQFYEIVQRVTHNIGNIAHQAQYLISTFLVKDAPLWYVVIRLTYLNQRIHLTKNELQVIKEKYKVRGLKMKRQLSLPHEITKNNSNDTMNGFENETMSILDHLVGGRKSRQVISIYGMPGLGKTTLAKKLYNHPFVREKFDKLSWFLVSQTYRIQSILIDILIHINNDLGEDRILNMEEETLVEHIYKTLKGRRYLVVMDDLWDSTLWDELQRCLPDDGNGSRVLLTSRNKGVAPPNSIIHELPFLSVEQCWELLQKKVFFHNRNCPPQLQMIGKTIAAKCRGLPLTVCVIAGVLSSMDEDESVWEKVGESLASYVKYGAYNIVMQILELSYYHLPNHLKSCFLSFRSYKEDEEISVEKLKRFWIAKGFIRKENERSMENVAEEYIMELIDRSLVMVAKRRLDGRGVKACVVHGLLRDFCLKISQGEGFWQYWSDELTSRFRFGVYVEALERKCATLWLSQHEHSFSSDGQASSYVRDMRSLRVLYFYDSDNCDCRCYILRVEYLINLRYLFIDKVPTWIENLVNLE